MLLIGGGGGGGREDGVHLIHAMCVFYDNAVR